MQTKFLVLASMAIIGVFTSPSPSMMGVKVIRSPNGATVVREVPHMFKRSCTNCVDVGGECTIGEGNCKSSQDAYCTDCGNGRVICVDQQGGSCEAP